MADVFISYKSARRPAAEHLAKILEAHGFTVWFDYDLVPGKNFGQRLHAELSAAKAVIVLWCTLSVDSEWVQDEARLAKRLGTYLPVRIDTSHPPLGFGGDDFVDISSWDGDPSTRSLDRLIDRLEVLTKVEANIPRRAQAELHKTWSMYGQPTLAQFSLTNTREISEEDRRLPPIPANPPPVVSAPPVATSADDRRSPLAAGTPSVANGGPPVVSAPIVSQPVWQRSLWIAGGAVAALVVLAASYAATRNQPLSEATFGNRSNPPTGQSVNIDSDLDTKRRADEAANDEAATRQAAKIAQAKAEAERQKALAEDERSRAEQLATQRAQDATRRVALLAEAEAKRKAADEAISIDEQKRLAEAEQRKAEDSRRLALLAETETKRNVAEDAERGRLAVLRIEEERSRIAEEVQRKADDVAKVSRRELITALQSKLKDAGCYAGILDGAWGTQSGKAFGSKDSGSVSFARAANASSALPDWVPQAPSRIPA